MQQVEPMLVVVVLVSMVMVALGYGVTARADWRARFFALPRPLQKLYVILFMAPVVALPLVPQQRLELPAGVALGGGCALLALAVVFWLGALWQMRGIPSVRRAAGLVTGGVYSWVRHPIYTGNFLILPGLGLMAQSLAALLYAPLWLVFLGALCLLEERGLREHYGAEYATYCRAVPYRLFRYVF